jgi:predicted component of type VI protein secretion system
MIDVRKVTTIKIKNFNEAMLVIQVRIRKFGIWNVLLDEGSNVNIISESLRKKIKLRKPQLAPFVVRMVDQRKV